MRGRQTAGADALHTRNRSMCSRLVNTRGRGRGAVRRGRWVLFLSPTALDMSTSPAVEARCNRAALAPPPRRDPVVTRGTPSRRKGCLPAGRGR
ncbi:hypothetical protein GCM10009837_08790 [Streptomyces durmitorensis]